MDYCLDVEWTSKVEYKNIEYSSLDLYEDCVTIVKQINNEIK
jgi:hypothetical protein